GRGEHRRQVGRWCLRLVLRLGGRGERGLRRTSRHRTRRLDLGLRSSTARSNRSFLRLPGTALLLLVPLVLSGGWTFQQLRMESLHDLQGNVPGNVRLSAADLGAERLQRVDNFPAARTKQLGECVHPKLGRNLDRKSTRLNSSHVKISYAVFCLKKKKTE